MRNILKQTSAAACILEVAIFYRQCSLLMRAQVSTLKEEMSMPPPASSLADTTTVRVS